MDNDIGLKVLYEPPSDAHGAIPTASVEYDSDTLLAQSILPTLTALPQHCRYPRNWRPSG